MSIEAASTVPASFGMRLRAGLGEFLRSERASWLFVLKSLLASALALAIAYRLDLPSARSALMTVTIVMQPQGGMVIAKSFYRILGTLVGCAFSLVLLGLFAQQRMLFLIGLTLWVGFCTAGAARYRNFQSYGFVLSGYTACLVGLPASFAPLGGFETAVARASVVIIGILSSAFVSEIVFPQRLSLLLRNTIRRRYATFEQLAHDVLRGVAAHDVVGRQQRAYVADIVGLESFRSSAAFEDATTRMRSRRVSLLNASFMSVYSSFHTLYEFMRRVGLHEGESELRQALGPIAGAIADQLLVEGHPARTAREASVIEDRLGIFLDDFPALVETCRQGLVESLLAAPAMEDAEGAAEAAEAGGARGALSAEDDRTLTDFDAAVEILAGFARDFLAFTATYASLRFSRDPRRISRSVPRFSPRTDWVLTLVSGLRAMVAPAALSAFWIAADWPSATLGIPVGTALGALFTALPQPGKVVRGVCLGFILAFPAGYVCDFMILPHLDGYPLLMLGLAPFLMIASYLSIRRETANIGVGFTLLFVSTAIPDNPAVYDMVGYVNGGLGQILGLLVSGLALVVVLPPGGLWFKRRLLAALRHQARDACTGPRLGLLHRFESGTHDLLFQMAAVPNTSPAEQENAVRRALSVLAVGRAVIELREAVAHEVIDQGLRRALGRTLASLGRLFRRPSPTRLAEARQAVAATMRDMPAPQPGLLPEAGHVNAADLNTRRLRSALRFIETSLLDEDGGLAGAPAKETQDAA